MRTSPEYLEAVSDLARDSESGCLPSFEIENLAAGIAARFGVADTEVRTDVADAARRTIEAEELPVRFFFVDAAGAKREVYVHADDFFCVCSGGIQVGEAHRTPQEADAAMSALIRDGEHPSLLSVEAYRQVAGGEAPVASTPYFVRGCWSDEAHPSV